MKKQTRSMRDIFKDLSPSDRDALNQYLLDLYPTATNGWIKIANLHTGKYYFYPSNQIANFEYWMSNIFCHNYYSPNNLYLTMNGFITPNSARESNLLYLNAFAIDLDYRKYTRFQNEEPLVVYQKLQCYFGILLPHPTYIEFGHQLRLIYIFDQYMGLSKKSRKKQIALVKKIKKTLENNLQSHPWAKDFGLDIGGNNLTSFVRIPFSFSTARKYKYQVKILKVGSKINLATLQKWWLPPLGNWYDPNYCFKKSKPKNTASFTPTRSSNYDELNRAHLRDLLKIQNYYNTIETKGHRELLCHVYFLYAYMLYESLDIARQAVLEYNANFINPLPERNLLMAIRNTPNYNPYKNSTLLYCLDITDDLACRLDLEATSTQSHRDRQKAYYYRLKAQREKNGETKKQKIHTRQNQIRSLLHEGKTVKEIANAFGISEATVRRDIRALNNDSQT